MSASLHPVFVTVLRLTLIAGLLAALFYLVPPGKIASGLTAISLPAAVAACVVTLASLLLRGLRWSLLQGRLRQPFLACLDATVINLGLNALVPGKAGELAKVVKTRQQLGQASLAVPMSALIYERLLDAIVLLAILTICGYAQVQSSEGILTLHPALPGLAKSLAIMTFLGLCTFMILSSGRFYRPLQRWLSVWQRPRWLSTQIRSAADHMHAMSQSLTHGFRLPVLLILSAGIWLLQLAGIGFIATDLIGIPEHWVFLGLFLAVTIAASAVPLAPGGWGLYEAAGVALLIALYPDVDREAALIFAIAVHLTQYLPLVGAYLVRETLKLVSQFRPNPPAP